MSIAIVIEGVLRKVSGGQGIVSGIDLYYGLATRSKLVLVTEDPIPEVTHWLASEGMREHARIGFSDVVGKSLGLPEARESALNTLSNSGFAPIELVIEPDPDVAKHLITRGYNVLLFCHAQYAMPSWRPDYDHTPRPWDELAQQIADEAYLRATDTRKNET